VLAWWALLIPTGWLLFLPGVLDRLKFTDGLVGHSLMAMAGFVTSLLILVLVALLEKDGDIFNSTWAFYAWQMGTLVYVVIMIWAGWIEGSHPNFTMAPSGLRNVIYGTRLVVGIAMTAASCQWLLRLTQRLRIKNDAREGELLSRRTQLLPAAATGAQR
jgi:cytochrome c oxidase cbb3-type subunit 1